MFLKIGSESKVNAQIQKGYEYIAASKIFSPEEIVAFRRSIPRFINGIKQNGHNLDLVSTPVNDSIISYAVSHGIPRAEVINNKLHNLYY